MNQENEFKPFIAADKVLPEITAVSVIIGMFLAVIFGAANAYLGLRVGMTVSASIPAAVLSMGIIRVILRRDSILENNIVQTIGSAGEALAAGAIFTLPVLFIWMKEWGEGSPSILTIFCITFVGGVLGVMFMIPLRSALIVKEHGTLPYPEGTACAEVLLAGEEGGSKSAIVFKGLGFAALYKFVADGLKLFPSEVHWEFRGQNFKQTGLGVDVLPALAGVGYICGPKISAYMLSGGILAWLVLMPLLAFFGADSIVYPGDIPINEMSSWEIWSFYVRYIGAGAVATGGIISLIKSVPLMVRNFSASISDLKNTNKFKSNLRTQKDLDGKIIIASVFAMLILAWLLPAIPVNIIGAVLIGVFGFFFATVASRIVGLIGSSNSPVSGMTIATLLFATTVLKVTGNVGHPGMKGAIAIGAVICVIAGVAGDTSQDLKTGYIVGATPYKQQIGELIGITISAISIGGVLYLLNAAWGYGSPELPAPQATLMKLVVEGVMNGNLPWALVFTGAGIAIVGELCGIAVMPFAVGIYLPVHLTSGIMIGGIARFIVDKKKDISEKVRKDAENKGILFSSGLIAGEGLVGILLAALAVIKLGDKSIAELVKLNFNIGQVPALVIYLLLGVYLVHITGILKKKESK